MINKNEYNNTDKFYTVEKRTIVIVCTIILLLYTEYNKYIAISFWYNQNNNQPGKTQVSAVCLIQSINKNHCLNITNQNLTINNLIIGQHKTNKKMKDIKPKPQKSTQTALPC